MRNFQVMYGFLPSDRYAKLKKEVDMNEDYKGKMMRGMRSHFDIVEQKIDTPELKSFIKDYCNNPKYWYKVIENLHIKDIVGVFLFSCRCWLWIRGIWTGKWRWRKSYR